MAPEEPAEPPDLGDPDLDEPPVRWAVEDVEHVVPGDATTRDELLIASALFTPLTRVGPEGRAQPALALDWTAEDDATRWRFSLDPEARFTVPGDEEDETLPVTAQDVAFAWDRAAREGRAGFLLADVTGHEAVAEGRRASLEGVRALDDHTLEVVLDRPHGQLDLLVSHPSLAPLPASRWEDDPQRERTRPIGNGPFVLDGEDVGGPTISVRAPRDPAPRQHQSVEGIRFQRLSTQDAYVAFQQERLHVAPVPRAALTAARARYGELGVGEPGGVDLGHGPALTALGVRVDGALEDAEVRRAVSSAIDRQALVDALPDQGLAPADGLLLDGLPAGGEGRCDHCAYAPFSARAALAEADLDSLTLLIDDDPVHEPLIARLEADLAEAGLALEVERRPYEAYWDAVRAGQGDLFRVGWAPEHLTGLDVLWPLLHREGRWSLTGLEDEGLDAALEEARATTNPLVRQQRLAQAEDLAHEQAVLLPLLDEARPTVHHPTLEGVRPHPLGRLDLRAVGLRAPDDPAS